jgi:capsular polysaccharide biosynthesis protein
MTEQTMEHNDEISLLDILVTLAESWKLLVLGPLLAGVLAGGLSFLWPKTYESVAIVRLTEAELGLVNSAPVLDVLIEKFGLLPEFDGIQEDARLYLSKKIVVKFDKKTNFATITATAITPERAQDLGRAVIDALVKELLPRGKNKAQVEQQILSNERVINSSTDAIELLKKQMSKAGQADAGLELVMKYYTLLTAEIEQKELQNIELKRNMTVKGDEMYVQHPSLPQRKVPSKRSLVVLTSVLSALFALLLYVFARKAFASIAQDPRSAAKLLAIRAALGVGLVGRKSRI